MEELNIYEETAVTVKKKRSVKKTLLILLISLLLICAISAAVYFATADFRRYEDALSLFEDENYKDAAVLFEELGNFKDSEEKALESRYEIARDLKSERDYHAAIDAFTKLDGYQDSDYLIKVCYYSLGHQEYSTNSHSGANYTKAIEYFTLADDYHKAAEYRNKSIEKHAVKLFAKGHYNKAEEYFAMLDEEYLADIPPRFVSIKDTIEFFHQCENELTEEITFYVGDGSRDIFGPENDHLYTYLPARGYISVNFQNDTKLMTIRPLYRPGDRIVFAEKNGRHDILLPEELTVLEKAKQIVEEAKSATSTEFELELWLYKWICNNTEYNTPDLEKDKPDANIGYRQHSCIGALIDKKINCQGYADTFELLGTLAGLEIRSVSGVGVDGEEKIPHAWNMIKLDGLWYFADVTYDDPIGSLEEIDYFTWLNTPYAMEDHIPDIPLDDIYDFAEVENPSYCYYDVYSLNFSSEKEAAKYAVDMHGKRVDSISIRVKGVELNVNSLNDRIESYLKSYGYTYASWRTNVLYKNGNSYIYVYWS